MQNTTCFTTISQKKKTHTGHYPRLLVCFAETKLIISTVLRCGKTCFYKGLAQSGMSSSGNEGHASSSFISSKGTVSVSWEIMHLH